MKVSARMHVLGLAVTICYLVAFTSLLVQLPALYGTQGVEPPMMTEEPASLLSYLMRTPSLLMWREYFGLSVDVAMEAVAIGGVLLSVWQLSLRRPHPLLFLAMFVLYHTLFTSGGTFLSFQWDILLLEAGWACVWTFPLFSGGHNPGGQWLLRFCVFKLMVMAGAVKLLSQCPTWPTLTATEVHFASQCLPTPLAWYFHSAPPLIHRVEVAATLWIELVAPVLLLVPSALPVLPRAGVVLQILLQLIIALSGNYTFFNLLTMVLCYAAMPEWGVSAAAVPTPEAAPRQPWTLGRVARTTLLLGFTVAQLVAVLLFALVTINRMIYVEARESSLPHWWQRWDVVLSPALSRDEFAEFKRILDEALPLCVWWAGGVIVATSLWWVGGELLVCTRDVLSAVWSALRSTVSAVGCLGRGCSSCTRKPGTSHPAVGSVTTGPSHSVGGGTRPPRCAPFQWLRVCAALASASCRLTWASASVAAVLWTFLVSATMLLSLRPETLLKPAVVFPEYGLMLAQGSIRLPWRVASGYGLFRSMTGVGSTDSADEHGLPVVETARPELEIQGLWAEEGLCDSPLNEGAPSAVVCAPRPLGREYASQDASQMGRAVLTARYEAGGAATVLGAWGAGPLDHPPEPRLWTWRPLHLPYKPGDVWTAPKFVAPHQPRVDWQMWFAALSPNPRTAAWLLRWTSLLMEANSPAAFALLDTATYPLRVRVGVSSNYSDSGSAGGGRGGDGVVREYLLPPAAIRIVKYVYDFTRADAPFARNRHAALDPQVYAADLSGALLPSQRASSRSNGTREGRGGEVGARAHSGDASVREAAAGLPWWQRRLDTTGNKRAGGWKPGDRVPLWVDPFTLDSANIASFIASSGLPPVVPPTPPAAVRLGEGGGAGALPVQPRKLPGQTAPEVPFVLHARMVLQREQPHANAGAGAAPLSRPSHLRAEADGLPDESEVAAQRAVAAAEWASLLQGKGPRISCAHTAKRALRFMNKGHKGGGGVRSRASGSDADVQLAQPQPVQAVLAALRVVQSSSLLRVLGTVTGDVVHLLAGPVRMMVSGPSVGWAVGRALVVGDITAVTDFMGEVARTVLWSCIALTDALVDDVDRLALGTPQVLFPLVGQGVCTVVTAWRGMGLSSSANAGHVLQFTQGSAATATSGSGSGAPPGATPRPLRLVFTPSSVHHSPLWLLVLLVCAGVGAKLLQGRKV